MWKPFAQPDDPPPTPTEAPVAQEFTAQTTPDGVMPMPTSHVPMRRIAEIELLGDTVVATMTITELSQADGADKLADLLLELSETGATHFVLDLQNVQFMDTTCLGCLVEALNRISARGGRIALANPNHNVHYVFRLTRLDRVFQMCQDVMTALDAVRERPEE